MTIDSHHHLWHYTPAEYGWISDEMRAIRRDFLPADLAAALASAGVDGAVAVQARQSLVETRWLLGLARQSTVMRGVVGWVPLATAEAEAALAALADEPKLKGVRHVLQDEPDDDFVLRPGFNHGVSLLARFGLAYDVLIFERQLPNAVRFVDRHPGQRFILDHIAKPRIRAGELEPWRRNLGEMARRENVWCKLSGLVTEADHLTWTPEQLRPYIETVLEAFGPRRVMFGSDWPVCLVACGYDRWAGIVRAAIADLSPGERAAIMGENAVEAYRL